jgi:DNA-binding NarL/FixJ family response regulator
MAELISIVMADDHPIVRRGLRISIEECSDLRIVGEAGDGDEAIALMFQHRPRVAILDVDMPKLDGFGVARKAQNGGLETKIVFLTLHTNEDIFHTAIDLGANGYVLKDSASREIVTSVRAAAAGQMYVSPAMTAHLVKSRTQEKKQSESSSLDGLTLSERRILQLIALGKTSKEIGDELNIHYRTVENHRTNVCRKLGLEGANALLRFSMQNKI